MYPWRGEINHAEVKFDIQFMRLIGKFAIYQHAMHYFADAMHGYMLAIWGAYAVAIRFGTRDGGIAIKPVSFYHCIRPREMLTLISIDLYK